MRTASHLSAIVVAGLFAGSVQAMPAAPLNGAGLAATVVRDGCGGGGWHRNVYGACVPNAPATTVS